MTEANILSGSVANEGNDDWTKYFRFRRPSDLDGLTFGFLFRVISATLAGLVVLIFSLVFGAVDGWRTTNLLIIFDGLVISIMVLIGEHFRSRVFERVVRDEFFSNEESNPANLQYLISTLKELNDVTTRPNINPASISRKWPLELRAKRIFDILFSAISLILLFPLFVLIAATIRFSSPGPVFFSHSRYGFRNEKFQIYKFRTMRMYEKASKSKAFPDKKATSIDWRLTAFGSFLRKSSLDELPQLINVLRGDMSIVGPRPLFGPLPEEPEFQALSVFLHYAISRGFKPGITGWAQVNGWRGPVKGGDLSTSMKLEYDLYYLKNWSVMLDFKIILLTIYRGFLSAAAF